MRHPSVVISWLLALCTVVLPSVSRADNNSHTIALVRTSDVTDVTDAAGKWQFDGGEVQFNGNTIGRYARTKRTVLGGGTDPQNTAALTITIFVLGQDPPLTVTLEGSFSFNNNQMVGAVSASSAAPSLQGMRFQGTDAALMFGGEGNDNNQGNDDNQD